MLQHYFPPEIRQKRGTAQFKGTGAFIYHLIYNFPYNTVFYCNVPYPASLIGNLKLNIRKTYKARQSIRARIIPSVFNREGACCKYLDMVWFWINKILFCLRQDCP
jgi:hypothetical protein